MTREKPKGGAPRVFVSVLVVTTLASFSAVIVRTTQAAAEGDTKFVVSSVTGIVVGFVSVTAFLLVILAMFVPGPAHARRVAAKFPGSLAIATYFGLTARERLRDLTRKSRNHRAPLLGVTIKVDANGVSIWTGVFALIEVLNVPWADVVGIELSTEEDRALRFPGLKFEIQQDGRVTSLTLNPSRGKFLGLGKLTDLELDGLREKILSFNAKGSAARVQ